MSAQTNSQSDPPATPQVAIEVPWTDEPDQELIMHLERDQLVAETGRAVAPAILGSRALVGLWALRIFAVLVSAMVIYTFIARLH